MSTPAPLRAAIAADLRPVKPLASPAARALTFLPLAVAIVVSVPLMHSVRFDMAVLGVARGWLLSFLQAAAGVAVVGLAFRESVPGRALSALELACAFGLGVLVPLGVLLATTQVTLIAPPGRHAWRIGLICLRTSALAALPALIVSETLVARALPSRPVLTGALYGLGCGVIADAGLRLFCEFSAPSHVLAAHGAGIAVAMLAGAVVASIVHR